MALAVIAAASRDPAVIDQSLHMLGEIFDKQYIFLDDGSFKNEPGSYGGIFPYAEVFVVIERLLGEQWLDVVSASTMDKIHKAIINISQFPFSNGHIPHLNGGGCLNQLGRDYFKEIYMLEELFPDDQEHIELYKRIEQQENNRVPGDIIDNHNFVVHGWGYAMLRAEDAPWDRRMETLLSSKHLMSDPGDHVSHDGLGIVVYGLGAILTPRYGYSWIARVPPFLNQVMMDEDYSENMYYGSFWHFDGRSELPSAVAHTGDGDDCSELPSERSRWCIQFPEYLFDAYLIASKDGLPRQYDWCLFNMGELTVVEPALLSWQDCSDFMSSYWDGGSYGGGPRAIASKQAGKVIADWAISNGPWELGGDPRLLRFPAAHSGRLRLIMADSGPSSLINAQIGPYVEWTGDQAQANSQDILVVRKPNVASHAFVDTLEPIADYEQAYVEDVTVVARGNHNQQLVRVTTAEGEDWIYLSGKWGSRSDGDQPIADIYTDADILAWRVVCNKVTRFYLAGGSCADIPNGSWDFGSHGNHYVADNDGG